MCYFLNTENFRVIFQFISKNTIYKLNFENYLKYSSKFWYCAISHLMLKMACLSFEIQNINLLTIVLKKCITYAKWYFKGINNNSILIIQSTYTHQHIVVSVLLLHIDYFNTISGIKTWILTMYFCAIKNQNNS